MENVKTVAMAYTTNKGQKEFFDAIHHGFCEDTTLQTQFFQSIEGCSSYFRYHIHILDDLNTLASKIESIALAICKEWFYMVGWNGVFYYTKCK